MATRITFTAGQWRSALPSDEQRLLGAADGAAAVTAVFEDDGSLTVQTPSGSTNTSDATTAAAFRVAAGQLSSSIATVARPMTWVPWAIGGAVLVGGLVWVFMSNKKRRRR